MVRITIFAILLGGAAFAHGSATGIVKERMDAMLDIAAQMKALGKHFNGSAPLSGDEITSSASQIAAHGGAALTDLFPEGSTMKPTEAAPAVWSDPAGFAELAKELKASAEALAEAGSEAQIAAFKRLAATCKDCHQTYRIEK